MYIWVGSKQHSKLDRNFYAKVLLLEYVKIDVWCTVNTPNVITFDREKQNKSYEKSKGVILHCKLKKVAKKQSNFVYHLIFTNLLVMSKLFSTYIWNNFHVYDLNKIWNLLEFFR